MGSCLSSSSMIKAEAKRIAEEAEAKRIAEEAEAKRIAKEAEDKAKAKAEAKKIVDDAKDEAERIINGAKLKAKADAEKIVKKAEDDEKKACEYVRKTLTEAWDTLVKLLEPGITKTEFYNTKPMPPTTKMTPLQEQFLASACRLYALYADYNTSKADKSLNCKTPYRRNELCYRRNELCYRRNELWKEVHEIILMGYLEEEGTHWQVLRYKAYAIIDELELEYKS